MLSHLQVALMVQLLTDGGPPALVSTAIVDALTSGAAVGRSDSVLLSADLVQRAGRHAMLLFVYVCSQARASSLHQFSSCACTVLAHCVAACLTWLPLSQPQTQRCAS